MNNKIKIFSLMILIAIALTLNFHGFSIDKWGGSLEWTKTPFVEIGHGKGIRSDDWLVRFTLWEMQAQTNPSSPAVNPLLGFGQNVVVTAYPIFAKHWSTFFKFHTWGFVLGTDFGMSWLWIFNSAGIFLSLFLILRLLTPSALTPLQSAFLSLAFLFSNFLQFWSYVPSPHIVYALWMLLAVIWIFKSHGIQILYGSLLFVWSGISFGLVLYPPFQMIMVHIIFITGIVLFLHFWRSVFPKSKLWFKILLLIFATSITGIVLGACLFENRDIIHKIQNTVYPGQRFSLGGGLSWMRLFQDTILPLKLVKNHQNLQGNICESAGFLNFIPLLLILCWSQWKINSFLQRIVLMLTSSYFLLIMIWWHFQFSPLIAKFTGLSFVPENRSVLALGPINLVLIVLWFSNSTGLKSKSKKFVWIIWTIGLCTILEIFFYRTPNLRSVSQYLLSLLLIFSVSLVSWFLIQQKKTLFSISFAMISLILTFSFNPIVFGGAKSFTSASPLLQLIQNTAAIEGAGPWIVFDGGAVASGIPLLVGARSFAGVYFYPQTELWNRLDPSNKFEHIWNRYAHVIFQTSASEDSFQITSPEGDVVIVETSLSDPHLLSLPFKFLMLPQTSNVVVPDDLYTEIGRTEKWIVYKRLLSKFP